MQDSGKPAGIEEGVERATGRVYGLGVASGRYKWSKQAGGSAPRRNVPARRMVEWPSRTQAVEVARVASRTKRARVVSVTQVSAR